MTDNKQPHKIECLDCEPPTYFMGYWSTLCPVCKTTGRWRLTYDYDACSADEGECSCDDCLGKIAWLPYEENK